jgi:hypothetical protein
MALAFEGERATRLALMPRGWGRALMFMFFERCSRCRRVATRVFRCARGGNCSDRVAGGCSKQICGGSTHGARRGMRRSIFRDVGLRLRNCIFVRVMSAHIASAVLLCGRRQRSRSPEDGLRLGRRRLRKSDMRCSRLASRHHICRRWRRRRARNYSHFNGRRKRPERVLLDAPLFLSRNGCVCGAWKRRPGQRSE